MNATYTATDSPPVVLIFGPFDPSGGGNLPADAVTCARLGCHPGAALTGLLVQDTAGLQEIHPVAPEVLDDQARCLLEDMRVQAFKVGPLYTTESISMVAQIAADYSDVPLVLHLSRLPDDHAALTDPFESEDVMLALCELLLPQTDLLVADHALLTRLHGSGLFDHLGVDTAQEAFFGYGADWILAAATPVRSGHYQYHLQDTDGSTHTWPGPAPGTRLADTDGPLTCAITCNLAHGMAMPAAVQQAITYANRQLAHTFQPGMGLRLFNRTHETDS
jgi:hydroxymethylpyrimidine/phosphomethylpyrimidine kinase